MEQIRMVDLQAQYKNIQGQIDEAIKGVIESTAFINGPEVKKFQKELEEYLNVKHVIPCANGTDALQVALMSLDLKEGDEVITSNFTFAATVEVIKLLKLNPILVDVDPDTFQIDPEEIKRRIGPKTKAIIPVHLFGQCSDMEVISSIAKENNLFVVEDTAQAIGAEFRFSNGEKKMAGTIGDLGTTSFFPSKNLGCYGDGGAIFTNNDELAALCKSFVNHGMGERYYYEHVGVNSRLDSLQAAILRVKLPYLNNYSASRNKAANYYDDAFKDIEELQTPSRVSFSSHVFHQYTLKVKENRNELKKFLEDNGVPAMIYYPVPLHCQKAYRSDNLTDNDFQITNKLCGEVISLPMHTELSEKQLSFISNKIKEFFKN